ncbi:hypothetical protein GCM10011390_27250 [Aureimonas endophytica]|uniref:Uncharacterized protein n=1 Tax=Aureimonas endophytica TaxID=2027858 RepID=A0A916ZQN1_9HYPH|nr:cell envelope integrity protein TolA [Aureimonas endophytica]GGE06720.1 hypothetical protein GCM10011390_27250 [Aureimonas endophytica]
MRSALLAPLALALGLLPSLAGAQVPDFPPINDGPPSGSPQMDPVETAPAPVTAAPVDTTTATTLPPPPPEPGAPPPVASGLPPIDIDRIMDRVKTCWTAIPKTYGTPAQGGFARIRLKLQSDGLLDGKPMIIDKPLGPIGAKFAESAAGAIERCQPYRLPPDRYAEWRLIEMRFDTIDPENPPPAPPPPPPAGDGTLDGLPPAATPAPGTALPPADGGLPQ